MGLNRVGPYRRLRKACPPFTVPRNVRGTQSAKIVFYGLACRDSYTTKTSLKILPCTPRGKIGEPLDASQCIGTEKGRCCHWSMESPFEFRAIDLPDASNREFADGQVEEGPCRGCFCH